MCCSPPLYSDVPSFCSLSGCPLPSSTLTDSGVTPGRVLFSEVVHTSQPFMKDLTVIEPAWLTELAPHFYEMATVRDD